MQKVLFCKNNNRKADFIVIKINGGRIKYLNILNKINQKYPNNQIDKNIFEQKKK